MTTTPPDVQMGSATEHVGSDSYPTTIVAVSATRKTVTTIDGRKYRWDATSGRYVSGRKGIRGYVHRLSLDRGNRKLDPHF